MLPTILTLVVALLLGLFIFAPKAQLETSIQIDAPATVVWEILTDVEGHAGWNPFLISMSGELREGARLTNIMRPSSGSEMTFRPVVLSVKPERELSWLGRLFLPRLFDGEHTFLLTPQDRGTLFTQKEAFRGIGLWLINVERFRHDFEAMNRALKHRAEVEAASRLSTNDEQSVP